MADNRCPMCGKENPPELEVCQHCEARLKPLIAPPTPGEEPPRYEQPQSPQEPEPEEEVYSTDWLSDLRAGGDEEEQAEPPASEPAEPEESQAEELDDWLQRLQSEEAGEDQPQEEPLEEDLLEEGEEQLLSRLTDLDGEEPLPSELPSEPAEGAAQPELSELPPWPPRAEDLPPQAPPAEVGGEPEPEQGFETVEFPELSLEGDESLPEEPAPDWLQDVPADMDDELLAEAREEEAQVGGEVAGPDWLGDAPADIDDEPLAGLIGEETEGPPEAGEPDWLRDAPADLDDEPSAEPAGEETAEPDIEAIPDWLQGAELEAPAGPEEPAEEDSPAPELPDWLKTGGLESDLPIYDEEDEELPAWLQTGGLEAIGGELAAEQELPDATPEPEGAGLEPGEEPPDWLQDFAPADLEEEVLETRRLPDPTDQDELAAEPDWLADIERPAPDELAPEGPAVDALEGEAPTWMPGEGAGEPALSLEEEQVPDWLRNLEAAQAESVPGPEGAVLEDELAGLVESDEDEHTPEWLAELQAKTPAIPAEAVGPPPEPPAERPAEPAPEPGPEPVPAEEPEAEPVAEGELPEWIAEISEEARAIEAREMEDVADELELTPAELPGWLKAMRPVEAVAPITPRADREREEAETAGPLAGLEGVVPVEPEITQVGRPPVFSAKVELTETQQRHINLLKELVSGEEDVQPRAQPGVLQPQRILRWVIALGLIVAVLWPLVTGGVSGLPFLFPPETLDFRQTITTISDRSPVLVAFDYQPAMAGEMEAAASAALDHLMIRNARLALVSTSPTGPALAERFLKHPRGVGGHEYRHGDAYVNLGYIPGQAAGLQNFAINPRTTLPQAFNRQGLPEGISVWDSPALQGVQALTDFALVVVLVDNADTARAWVEQVQPRLDGVPLLMVVSAQTEPMVRPYYEAVPRQVQGMVTGLSGGTPYEQANSQISGRSQLARGYWSAFSNGLLMAEVLILVGGAYNLVVSLFGRRQQPPIEEQA